MAASACAWWKTLPSDANAVFDQEIYLNAADIAPQVSWAPARKMCCRLRRTCPRLLILKAHEQQAVARSLDYMGLTSGTALTDITIDKVFIGSCTNGRIEDLRAAAAVAKGRKVSPSVKLAMVVPGSGLVKQQAEAEGLDTIFTAAGFEWREAGCCDVPCDEMRISSNQVSAVHPPATAISKAVKGAVDAPT